MVTYELPGRLTAKKFVRKELKRAFLLRKWSLPHGNTSNYSKERVSHYFISTNIAQTVLLSNRKLNGSTWWNSLKVEIIIQDLNDNSPIFPESELTIHIAENAQIGTEIRLDSATDADTAAYGIERYYLGEEDRLVENPYFDLQEEHINDVIIPILKVIFYFSAVGDQSVVFF